MSCCVNSDPNRYAGGGGGGITMKKKYASKFAKVSANKSFSLNGNTSHTYTGNPNSIISHDPFSNVSKGSCTTCVGNKTTTSVKNTKGYINGKLRASPLYSSKCYGIVNKELVDISGNLNKHFISDNRVQSLHTEIVKSKCGLDRENYLAELEQSQVASQNKCSNNVQNMTSNSRTLYLMRKCNITKDNNFVKGITPGYDIYYGDSTLFRRKAACNLHNPVDAKVIAC
jgi:hypothetical protein